MKTGCSEPRLPSTWKIQNQGESEETDVGVSVTISGGQEQIDVNQTITASPPAIPQTVSIPITKKPATGAVTSVTVAAAPVPGEKVKENNKATYQVVFTPG